MDPESDATVSAVSDKDMQSPGIDGAPHDGILAIQTILWLLRKIFMFSLIGRSIQNSEWKRSD